MSQYLIQSSHTPEECLQGLDEILAQGPDVLAGYNFACAVGDHSNHIAYATVEAPTAEAARWSLPTGQRDRASVIEVGKVTPEQVRSFHQGL